MSFYHHKISGVILVVLVLLGLFSRTVEARGFQRSMTGGNNQSVQSSGTTKTKFQRGQGTTTNRDSTVTGPRGQNTQVSSTSNTSYTKDEGVTHTGSSTVTTANGKTASTSSANTVSYEQGNGVSTNGSLNAGNKTLNTQSQTQKTDSGVSTVRTFR